MALSKDNPFPCFLSERLLSETLSSEKKLETVFKIIPQKLPCNGVESSFWQRSFSIRLLVFFFKDHVTFFLMLFNFN